jgi:hypothetical protein
LPLAFDQLPGTTEEMRLAVQFGEKIMDKEFNKKLSSQLLKIEKERGQKREGRGSKTASFLHFCPSESQLRPFRVAIEPLSHCDRAFAALR